MVIWTTLILSPKQKAFLILLRNQASVETNALSSSSKRTLGNDDFIAKLNTSVCLSLSPQGLLQPFGIYPNSNRLVIAGD